MTLEQRVEALEKEVAALKEQASEQPDSNEPSTPTESEQNRYTLVAELIERINACRPIDKSEYFVSVIIENLEHLLVSLR